MVRSTSQKMNSGVPRGTGGIGFRVFRFLSWNGLFVLNEIKPLVKVFVDVVPHANGMLKPRLLYVDWDVPMI
ncbi:hypothetical protein TWF225_008013 [Orbilia oligospora]|nr:hypothetical protein TWF225_008013 [Orbilia oligospora]